MSWGMGWVNRTTNQMAKIPDKIDLLALHLVGARLKPEPSHAVESRKYSRDPADNVEFPREIERQQKAAQAKKRKRAKK